MTTAEHRKAIPLKVKLAVLISQARCASCGERFGGETLQFDHRPALVQRPFNESIRDYEPPQNDPAHIDALHLDCHLFRTSGRRPGASQTVSTRGSDVGEAARERRIASKHEATRRRLLMPGRPPKPPSKWGSRKLRSRNDLRKVT